MLKYTIAQNNKITTRYSKCALCNIIILLYDFVLENDDKSWNLKALLFFFLIF